MVFGPDGKHLKDVIFTSRNPTCTTWGGRNHDILFLTSASDRSPAPREVDDGGHMFMYKPGGGIKGTPKFEFAG